MEAQWHSWKLEDKAKEQKQFKPGFDNILAKLAFKIFFFFFFYKVYILSLGKLTFIFLKNEWGKNKRQKESICQVGFPSPDY